MIDELKAIAYLSLAAMTIIGNLAAVIAVIVLIKYKVAILMEGQKKILDLMYDENGNLRFQTRDECGSCRKSCRDEICAVVRQDSERLQITIERLEKSIIRVHKRLDEAKV